MTLAEAKGKAERLRMAIGDGADPAAEKHKAKQDQRSETKAAHACRWLTLARGMGMLVVQNQLNGSLFVLYHDGSTFSGVGAPAKSGGTRCF